MEFVCTIRMQIFKVVSYIISIMRQSVSQKPDSFTPLCPHESLRREGMGRVCDDVRMRGQ